MHANQKGFHLVIIPIVLLALALISFSGWAVYKNQHNQTEKSNQDVTRATLDKKIDQINDLVKSADIAEFGNWKVNIVCGPTDYPQGYDLEADDKEISVSQAAKLKEVASSKPELQSDTNTYEDYPDRSHKMYSTTIQKTDWSVVIQNEKEQPFLSVKIPLDKKTDLFPLKNGICI